MAWEINGKKIRPQQDPRPIVENPWNSATLEFGLSFAAGQNTAVLTTASVATRLENQLGITPLDPDKGLAFRMVDIRAWNLSGGIVSMEVSNLLFRATDPPIAADSALAVVKDFAGRNHWSAVGFTWPKSHQTNVYNTTYGGTFANFTITNSTSTGRELLVRVGILWRGIIGDSISKGNDVIVMGLEDHDGEVEGDIPSTLC